MGEDQINKWIASIPLAGHIYLATKIGSMRESNHELERRNLQLAREKADTEAVRDSLETEVNRAQTKLDALDQLKKSMETCKSDMAVLQAEQDALQEKANTAAVISSANANRVLLEIGKKERWKAHAHNLREILKESDVEGEKAKNIIIPDIIENLGIRVLWFNEQEKVDFVTTAAAERLGSSKKNIASKTFSEIFDCPGIDWLLDVGPRYPLLIRDTQEEVGASVAEIPYGLGTTYAVALREKAAKEGIIQRLVPARLAAPLTANAGYRAEIAMALAKSTGKSKFLSNDVYIDLRKTENIDQELGSWLAKIIAERNESEKQGTVFLYLPSKRVHRQLRAYGIPSQNITLPRKEKLSYFAYNSPSAKILLAGSNS